jgi:peptide subunit release factor 1 (eRF1)
MSNRKRRSTRLAAQLPIRVFGTDFQGVDFVEDASTLIISHHGAKIALEHLLIADQEIRINCQETGEEAVFRVISRIDESEPQRAYWGVECTNPSLNIWGVATPAMTEADLRSVRVMLQCPECHARELFHMEENEVTQIMKIGGLLRECQLCGKEGLWKQVPYYEA